MNSQHDIYLLAGHSHSRRDFALEETIAACGKKSPTVAYIGAASGDSAFFFKLMTKSLLDAGAGKVLFAKLAGKRANIERAKDMLEESDIIHIGGGDVEKGMEVFERQGIVPLLSSLQDRGKLFFGLSAGSIMLARTWVRWPDPDDDDSAEPFECMGFARVLCDTHAESDDFSELRTLLKLVPGARIGYGIPSGAGLRVTTKGKIYAYAKPVWRYKKSKGNIIRMEDLEI
jgi:peptidase E